MGLCGLAAGLRLAAYHQGIGLRLREIGERGVAVLFDFFDNRYLGKRENTRYAEYAKNYGDRARTRSSSLLRLGCPVAQQRWSNVFFFFENQTQEACDMQQKSFSTSRGLDSSLHKHLLSAQVGLLQDRWLGLFFR